MKLEVSGQEIPITPSHTVSSSNTVVATKEMEGSKASSKSFSNMDSETKMALDQTTGLMQNITSDRITNKVLRKMPSDEYLHLLKLLDNIIAGSINKEI
jgi:uncharacterized FlaG/YvyC family protein